MANGAIFRIVPPVAANGSGWGSGVDAAFPAANAIDRQPKLVCQSNAGGAARSMMVEIDLGADTVLDGLAVLWTNLSVPGGQWQVYGAPEASGFGAAGSELASQRLFGFGGFAGFGVAPTTRRQRRFGLALGTTPAVRFVRAYLQDSASPGFIRIGNVLPLQRIDLGPSNFELGSGRRIDDQSTVRTLPGGKTYADEGGRVPVWRATWSNLSEASMRTLWSLLDEVGVGAPVLAVEDTDAVAGQAEAIHYGLIEAVDFHERVQLDKVKLDLRFRELL